MSHTMYYLPRSATRLTADLPAVPHLPSSITSPSRQSKPTQEPRWKQRALPDHRQKYTISQQIYQHISAHQDVIQGMLTAEQNPKKAQPVQLQDLPEEVQQGVLDIIMGTLSSTLSSVGDTSHGMRNWSNAMRHPRGKYVSELALVSRSWCRMIQERLFRHLKFKGTKTSLEECADWMLSHPHLQNYVRHIEVWVPVWERRAGQSPQLDGSRNVMFEQHARPHTVITIAMPNAQTPQEVENINQAYQLASSNATLDEVFDCVSCVFPNACIMTIEGGHCKKPPMIRQFRSLDQRPTPQKLSVLPNINTLILKGAWNIMREDSHFSTIAAALPNIREWHCTYAKPKTKAYESICAVIRHIPSNLSHLNLCLEGFYSKQSVSPAKMRMLQLEHHLCRDLGRIFPQLEALTYSGRICSALFTAAIEAAPSVRKPKLKSVDIIVKNCCRDGNIWNDSTGIHSWAFIKAFESVVEGSVRALDSYPDLNFLRIRFIDLDSPCALLNPYFHLQNNEITGMWNDEILLLLGSSRPRARFAELSDEIAMDGVDKDGNLYVGWPMQRPRSIKVGSYAAFANGALTIV